MRTKAIFVALIRFFGHLTLATYGLVILIFALGYPLVAAFDPQGHIVDSFFVAPSFAIPIAVGFLFGYRYGWRLPPLASRALFVPSMALIALVIYLNYEAGMSWALVWAKFFGTACLGEGCIFHFAVQVLGTAPLMSALSHTLGSEFGRRRGISARTQPAPSTSNWKARACVSLAAVVVFSFSIIRVIAQPYVEVRFEWSYTSGFRYAYISDQVRLGFLKILSAPVNQSILWQTKPRIAYELRAYGVKRAKGCVYPNTLWYLPIVVSLDHLGDNSCGIVNLDRQTSR
jgi:hypothetical protein